MANSPDFVCIGAQKAATSWFDSALRSVPEIFVPAIKETHYFTDIETSSPDGQRALRQAIRKEQIQSFKQRYQRIENPTTHEEWILSQFDHFDTDLMNDDWYRGIFEFASEHDVCGEVCPTYMDMESQNIRRLMQINPLVRVLMFVRDPVDRAWSQIRMKIRQGHTPFAIEQFLSDDLLSLMNRRFDYAKSIPRWEALTAPGRFRTIVYDRIVEDPDSVFREALEFIGLPGAIVNKDLRKRVNLGNTTLFPIELRAKLYLELEPQYAFLQSLFPEYVQAWRERHERALGAGVA